MLPTALRTRQGLMLVMLRGTFIIACLIGSVVRSCCQSVTIGIPSAVNFDVSDVSQASTGSPNPFTISFSSAMVGSGNSLRISVKANSANFTPPSGNSIPGSNLSWTVPGAVGGTGSPGTLSTAAYSQVYLSNANPSSGSVSLRWTLAAPGAGIRAGLHSITMIWKLDAL